MPVTDASNTCDTAPFDTAPVAQSCVGYFAGNALNQASSDSINAALTALGISYTGHFADYVSVTNLNGATDLTSVLGTLTGLQTIGVHYSNGGGIGSLGNVTAFYQVDFGSGDTLRLSAPASASLTLFTRPAAVPEASTWMMMLVGFGAVSFSLRRKRQPRLAQLA